MREMKQGVDDDIIAPYRNLINLARGTNNAD